jgi:hypothetical protein
MIENIRQAVGGAFLLFLFPFSLVAQEETRYDFGDFGGVVLMDSIVVSASRTGFDIQDFIRLVREDESFYQAFRNIRTLSYLADNQLVMYDKKSEEQATYRSKTRQFSDGDCRRMEFLTESISGNFYKRKKKKKLRYYTFKLFDRLFFTHGEVCETTVESGQQVASSPKGMEKHVSELKKLIFSPGEKADVPLIGKKTEIFSEEMSAYYDFSITSKIYKDSIDCYVFSAVIKPEFQERKVDKTVIKSLNTYFDKSTFQVMARDYQLMYYGALFDFDIMMKIELKKLGELYVPAYLSYDGFWNVPLKKPEISKFSSRFYDYVIP